MNKIRGIRGATTAQENTKNSILDATIELLGKLIENNCIHADDVAAAVFTTTKDLNAEFPAQAARKLGWKYVALMCAQEIDVEDAPGMCIRILILINTDKSAQDLENVYIRGAKDLRSRGIVDSVG
mgnify:FL=1